MNVFAFVFSLPGAPVPDIDIAALEGVGGGDDTAPIPIDDAAEETWLGIAGC